MDLGSIRLKADVSDHIRDEFSDGENSPNRNGSEVVAEKHGRRADPEVLEWTNANWLRE